MKQKMFTILLPTEDKNALIQRCGTSEWIDLNNRWIDDRWIPQHLYICSEEEIREGDNTLLRYNHPNGTHSIWFLTMAKWDGKRMIYQQIGTHTGDSGFTPIEGDTKLKIIASTDNELNLPSIDARSIELFIKHQPKEVYVEMVEVDDREKSNDCPDWIIVPKVNSSNEISFSMESEDLNQMAFDAIKGFTNITGHPMEARIRADMFKKGYEAAKNGASSMVEESWDDIYHKWIDEDSEMNYILWLKTNYSPPQKLK